MNRTLLAIAIGLVLSASPLLAQSNRSEAVFAGGCFWCMEKPFDQMEGVISTTSGYAGGHTVNPTYEEVTHGDTGHAEVVRVVYDPKRVSYEDLLYVYWRNVDPFDDGGQFCDRGASYRPEIFYNSPQQANAARRSKAALGRSFSRTIEVDITELDRFYSAEDYHQNYYARNPIRYNFYRSACGRDARLREIWADEAGGESKRTSS